jgi:amidase
MTVALDPVGAVEACLQRLDDDHHNAVVHRRDAAALADAHAIAQRLSSGSPVGPLAGRCFTVKAALRTGELPATAGSLLLDDTAGSPATVVQRLRRADAVLVGVTNCAEFALGPVATNRRYGATVNPAFPSRTPGGSSAGCAAAVAAGLVPFSVGTDYGGSVRYPAHCTGVWGLRPAAGSVPTDGQVPTPPAGSARARFSTPGILAADPTVLAATIAVILGRALTVQRSVRAAWTAEGDSVDPEIAAAVRAVADCLQAEPIARVGPNPLTGANDLFGRIRDADDLEPIRSQGLQRPDVLTEPMRAALERPISPLDSAVENQAIALRAGARQFFDGCPLLIAPVATCLAPSADAITPFEALAPSRAVSLLGVASFAIPAGTSTTGIPIGVQLVGHLPALLWATTQLGVDPAASCGAW